MTTSSIPGIPDAAGSSSGRLVRKVKRMLFFARETVTVWLPAASNRQAFAAATRRSTLERRLARIASLAQGRVAMTALHLASGRSISIDGSARVPAASLVKLPIAVAVLSRVDRGEFSLDTRIGVDVEDARPGTRALPRPPAQGLHTVSVREIVEAMLIRSDNGASDLALRIAGGVGAVRARLEALGITGFGIDRSIGALLADLEGVESERANCAKEQWRTLTAALPIETRRAAMNRLLHDDARDTCTADATVRLLAAIHCGAALSAESTRLLLDTMVRCRTGKHRLKGLLPPDAVVPHKTGSLTSSLDVPADRPFLSSDAGLLDLPNRGGTLAIAVFIVDSPHQSAIQDRIIARLGRRVYDEFAPAMLGPNRSLHSRDRR
jgi:beta-lactamase class A